MTGNDLHSRLVSSLTARLDRARAAQTERRAMKVWPRPRIAGLAEETGPGTAAYFAANAPDVEIRRVEATLRVVQRHAPEVVTYAGGRENTECHECSDAYPCQDIADIATGAGIEP